MEDPERIPPGLARELAQMGRDEAALEEPASLRRLLVAAMCCVVVAIAILQPLLTSLTELPVPEVTLRALPGALELELPRDLALRHPTIEVLDIQRGAPVVPSSPPRFTPTSRHLAARVEGIPGGRSYEVEVRFDGGAQRLGRWTITLPPAPGS